MAFGFTPVEELPAELEVDVESLLILQEFLDTTELGVDLVWGVDDFRFALLVAARHLGLVDVENPVVADAFDARYSGAEPGSYLDYVTGLQRQWAWALRTADALDSQAVLTDPGLRQVLVLDQMMKDRLREAAGLEPDDSLALSDEELAQLASELIVQLEVSFGANLANELAAWREPSWLERFENTVRALARAPRQGQRGAARTIVELSLSQSCDISDVGGLPHAVRANRSVALMGFSGPASGPTRSEVMVEETKNPEAV